MHFRAALARGAGTTPLMFTVSLGGVLPVLSRLLAALARNSEGYGTQGVTPAFSVVGR